MGHAYQPQQSTSVAPGAPRVFVEFKFHPKHNPVASAAEGRAIYDEVEYVRIIVPGDRDEVHRPVTNRDREMYAAQYAAFKAQTSQEAVSGTPLDKAPFITSAQVLELAAFNCRTVEQLAAMPDAVAQKFMAIQQLKRKAADFLTVAAGNAPVEQLRTALKERDNDIEVLKRQVSELSSKLNAKSKG